jgi:hypothetical protein
MCTLTFIPGKEAYIFTSNRDEHESRSNTLFPVIEERNGSSVYFPQDPKAGGTWLATSNTQKLSVLLNGAFERHPYRPPYRKSRGLVLLDTYNYPSLDAFYQDYDLANIEAFTIVQFDRQNPEKLNELRWDGNNRVLMELDAKKAHIWSSAQLYSKEIRDRREEWFNSLLTKDPDAEMLNHFHEFGGSIEEQNTINTDFGNGLKTISISQLLIYPDKTNFNYRNLVNKSQESLWIAKKEN